MADALAFTAALARVHVPAATIERLLALCEEENDSDVVFAEIEREVEAATAPLRRKNEELTREVEVARQKADTPAARAFAELQAEHTHLTAEAQRLEAEEAHQGRERERMQREIAIMDAQLVDMGVSAAVRSAGVLPPYIDAVKAMLKAGTKFQVLDAEQSFLVIAEDGTPASQVIATWAKTTEAQFFLPPRPRLNDDGTPKPKVVSGKQFDAMPETERNELLAKGGSVVD